MPRDTVRERRINLTSVKRPFQIFFWGWEGVGVESSPIWEGSQVPGVPLRLGSRGMLWCRSLGLRSCMYLVRLGPVEPLALRPWSPQLALQEASMLACLLTPCPRAWLCFRAL